MAWGELTKEQVVEKLKDAGFNTQEITDKLKTISEGSATKAEVEALTASMTDIKNTLVGLQTTLQTNKENNNNNNSNNDPNNRSNNGGGSVNRQEPLTIDPLKFMEDPTGAVRQLLNEQTTPIMLHTLHIAAEVAYNTAKNSLPYFDKFETEIKELWDKYTPAQKATPGELINNLYNLIKGRHMDEIIMDTNKKEGKYAMIQSGGTSVINRPDGTQTKKPEELLTDQELASARKLGITPADWAASKAGLKYV
jgi:hypothetical protein